MQLQKTSDKKIFYYTPCKKAQSIKISSKSCYIIL